MAALSQALSPQAPFQTMTQRSFRLSPTNCTHCSIWQGDECFEYKPCVFCNASVECLEPLFCQDNICTLDPYYGGAARKDPLGRIIAMSLLAIFLLGIFTLCLRICSSTCGADGRKCCVVQCAISVQCCCEWKSGRLRIVTSPGNSVEPTGAHHRRESLYPPPPPAYGEIYPEHENGEARQTQSNQPQTQNASRSHQNRQNVEALSDETSAGRSRNFLNWFRPTSPIQTLHQHNEEQFVAIQDTGHGQINSEGGGRHHPGNGGWFHRAATVVIGSRHRQRLNPVTSMRPDASTASWTTLQSADLHRINQNSGSNEDVGNCSALASGTIDGRAERPLGPERKYESPDLTASQTPNTEVTMMQRSGSVDDSYSFNFNDIDETTSENLNSAINSLLDFNTSEEILDKTTTSIPSVGGSNNARQTSADPRNEIATSHGIGDSVISIDDFDDPILWDESRPESTTVVNDVWTNGRKSRWQNNELQ